MCTCICLCYSKAIARKSKLKIFILYLQGTTENDLTKQCPKNKPPKQNQNSLNPTSGKGKEFHGKKNIINILGSVQITKVTSFF